MKRFYYDNKDFYLDDRAFNLHSGAVHYFRVPRMYWRDRLLKLKECGLNCVETYVAWNLHEPKEDSFDFSGDLDLREFIDEATELGLWIIVRPGPYICAEWEGGGLPAWLLECNEIGLRCDNVIFLEKTERYLKKVFEIVRPCLVENGGNILMMQIENEYGSFGNDKSYLSKTVDIFNRYVPECLLFTSDGLDPSMLISGTLDGILACANFGSETESNMEQLKKFRPDQPLMCMEFWCGWFDHWGGKHTVRPTREKLDCIEEFLKNGYSFNIYMFCGGTNFGFMNGMNAFENGETQATVTSYDYDAFLTESGDRTEAYYELRKLMQEYADVPPLTASESVKTGYGSVRFTERAALFDNVENIGTRYTSVTPLHMEECGQSYGYILYRTKTEFGGRVILEGLADRALVFADGELIGVTERNALQPVWLKPLERSAKIDVLVENAGRINYGPRLLDRKGISGMRMGGQRMFHFDCISLPMDNLENVCYTDDVESMSKEPGFYKAEFTVDSISDTFLRPSGFSRGFAVLNGFNLGRFNNIAGPQKTLYVPGQYLREGENTLIIFDSDGANELLAEFTDEADLG